MDIINNSDSSWNINRIIKALCEPGQVGMVALHFINVAISQGSEDELLSLLSDEIKAEAKEFSELAASTAQEQAIVRENDRAGVVYVLPSKEKNTYKLGKAVNAEERLRSHQTYRPDRIEYLIVIKTSDRHILEKKLKDKFSEQRISGEWYWLYDDDLDFIRSLDGVQ